MPSRRTCRSSTSGSSTAAALTVAWTVHHATPKSWATSATARPESITASSTAARSRLVHRARTGSCAVAGVNVRRRTRRLATDQPRLADHHLDPAGVRDVADPLHRPGMDPPRHHPTLGATVVPLDRLHLDPATAQRQVDRLDHPIAGQVEDHARSVTLRAHRLEQARGPSSMDA